ncbi:glycosyltransferase [Kineosporia sp. R_H_3]|uniref:glycosyltransferase n=1 Tax=Kineosporia sp. R_H_3 TaxID=1961848 RepID=UPI000B4BB3F6|nr:glycosyltransferase [Kineosporia sp. R_H_3]
MHVVLFSLEPWDGVWRRNQHLVANLVEQGLVEHVSFVEPPLLRRRIDTWSPMPGVSVVAPWMAVPKRLGGLRTGARDVLRRVSDVDVFWVNDPAFGVHALGRGTGVVYDVTDDWRGFTFPARILRRITRAEDALAAGASTVVCSEVLAERWAQRYGVRAAVVCNGVDATSWAEATPGELPGPGPHVGYVGTLHQDRLDVDLVRDVAARPEVGTVHLVGPDALDEATRARLADEPKIRFHGPVASADVPGAVLAMDVLVSPHRLSDFTLSLDAIKAREYVVSGRPVVATPTSGFQRMPADEVTVASGIGFVDAVASLCAATPGAEPRVRVREEWTWASRAREFERELVAARAGRSRSPGPPVTR